MILRFDPFRELERMTDQLGARTRRFMAFDAVRHEGGLTVYFDVPGVGADDIEVRVERNELTVTVERTWDASDDEVVVTERPQGTFTRTLMLSDVLDTEALEADLADGVLTLRMPIAEQSRPRRIAVGDGAGQRRTIEADTTSEGEGRHGGSDNTGARSAA